MRPSHGALQLLLVITLASGCDSEVRQPPAHAAEPVAAAANEAPTTGPVAVAFRNVNFHVAEGVVLEVRRIDGALVSTVAGQPPTFDDVRSYRLRIDYGEVAMSVSSLTRLMNDHVFAYRGAPLTDLEIKAEDGGLRQKGTLHKGLSIPFSILADLSATPDGRLRLHPRAIKAAGVPAGGLMKMFGLELDGLIKVNRSPGVALDGNDFLLDPGRVLPAPGIIGRVTRARVEGDRVVQIFGSPGKAELIPPDRQARNFMYYRGGSLRFGKLTMADADMQLIDADASDVFDFFPQKYVAQLVAGYSKNTPSGGLKVYMPDYNEANRSDLKPSSRAE